MHKQIVILLTIAALNLNGQDFRIQKVDLNNDKIFIYYNLLDTFPGHTYSINLYHSRDNFISPLQKTRGDIGMEVKPGINKKIEWAAKEELGPNFSAGEVSLEVKGRLYVPFIRLDGEYPTMSRGKKYELTWTGGTQQNILNFDLYQGNKKITSFSNIANVGHYTILIPTSVKPGQEFRFRISDTKNKDQVVFSKIFTIERRVPLLLKIVPPVLLGIGTYWLIQSNKPKPLDEPPNPGDIDG
jgi:hypothetical protein